MRIGIVGFGFVGTYLYKILSPAHEIQIYDPFIPPYQNKSGINDCDLVYISVPTESNEDGSCDLSIVENSVGWIEAPICIRSTVVPGTTERLAVESGKKIAFAPEYAGETLWHSTAGKFVIVGGDSDICDLVIKSYQAVWGPEAKYMKAENARTAELCKYMTNCFLATKVTFISQFYEIAKQYDIDFDSLRELWLSDQRVNRSHTMVTSEQGFGGKCLPKDIRAMISDNPNDTEFLSAVWEYNKKHFKG